MMLPQQTTNSRIDIPQQILKSADEYVIKIDYFDQKGTKSFENNIPLRFIFDTDANIHKTNLKL